MKQFSSIILRNPLFQGITEEELVRLLPCLEGRVQRYEKGEVLLLAGQAVERVGLVLSGLVQVMREDAEGKQHLLTTLAEGELFGEVFACAGILESPVTVVAAARSEALLIHYRKIPSTCTAACVFHQRLLENMLVLLAQKTLMLHQKMEILAKRTTRERLLLYFDACRQGAQRFSLPLNREALAAYLCVDRSAMSAELSRMQRDGLIRYQRNTVELCPRE